MRRQVPSRFCHSRRGEGVVCIPDSAQSSRLKRGPAKKLDLLQFSASLMARRRASPPKIVGARGQATKAKQKVDCYSLNGTPNANKAVLGGR